MLLAARRPPDKVRVRLTAMIDVVFLLIIFFMTVSQLTSDTTEELPLPEAEHGKLVRDRHGRFVINMRRDGTLVVATQIRSQQEVTDLLRRAVERDGADEVKCVLRVHRHTPFRTVQLFMSQLTESGIWRVAYSVVEQD